MDSFETNKIVGAVLMTLLVTTVIGHVGDILVREPEAGKSHFEIAGAPATAAPSQQASVPAGPPPLAPLLAKASVADGQSAAAPCKTCHTFGKGEPAKIGPNLYAIVGEKIAAVPGYEFSDALKKIQGTWTFDELNEWLEGPQKMAPGTKMTFAGVPDPQKRADVIAYLNSLSDHPEPLPK